MEGPGPSSFVCAPKAQVTSRGTGSLCPNCTQGHQMAVSHWRALLWRASLASHPQADRPPVRTRREKTGQGPTTFLPGDPQAQQPRRSSPSAGCPFPSAPRGTGRGGAVALPQATGCSLALHLWVQRGPRDSLLHLERPLWSDLRPGGAWQPEVAPTSTTHPLPSLGGAPSTAATTVLSCLRPSVRQLNFTQNIAAESGPDSRPQWFCGAGPWGVGGFTGAVVTDAWPVHCQGSLSLRTGSQLLGKGPTLPPRPGSTGLREPLLL